MKNKTEPNPFELLLDDNTVTLSINQASGLNFGNMLKSNNKRKDLRNQVTGRAMVYST
ncbi:MAG: hypothetical protein ABL930_14065 [Pseudobdellovibrio sp.]